MKTLFPSGEDGTSIINDKVFHVKKDDYNQYVSRDNTDKIFKEVILEFENYDKENGKFILESIEDRIPDYYSYKNGILEKNAEIIGFDKMI